MLAKAFAEDWATPPRRNWRSRGTLHPALKAERLVNLAVGTLSNMPGDDLLHEVDCSGRRGEAGRPHVDEIALVPGDRPTPVPYGGIDFAFRDRTLRRTGNRVRGSPRDHGHDAAARRRRSLCLPRPARAPDRQAPPEELPSNSESIKVVVRDDTIAFAARIELALRPKMPASQAHCSIPRSNRYATIESEMRSAAVFSTRRSRKVSF